MLSLCKLNQERIDYYLDMARLDYYFKGGEPLGQWYGEGAAELGLAGTVVEAEIRNVYRGFSPNGKIKLVKNAGDAKRAPGLDLTFCAPKSVSVAWACCDPANRHIFQKINKESVQAALDYLQDSALFTRLGKAGKIRERAKLVAALHEHSTSRCLDPHLHIHVLQFNTNGTRGTSIDLAMTFKHKMAAGALFRLEETYLLRKDLGIRTEREGSCFEIVGVPKKLIKALSKRRNSILEKLAPDGVRSAIAAQFAAFATRPKKEFISRRKMFRDTLKLARKYHFGPEQVRKLKSLIPQRLNNPRRAQAAIERAMERITSQQSHFLECDLVRFTAEEAQCEGLSAKFVLQAVKQYLSHSPEIVQLQSDHHIQRYATKEMVQMEKDMLSMVKATKHDREHRVPVQILYSILDKYSTSPKLEEHPSELGNAERKTEQKNERSLSYEQKKAVRHLTQSMGSIHAVFGRAGTGKTYMLKVTHDVWKKAGYEVIGASLSGKAALGLQTDTGIPSSTLHRLLGELNSGKRKLNSKTIVVVDEAGMIGTKQMTELITHVKRSNAALKLIGDPLQLQSVDAGGPFQAIGKEVNAFVMKDIRRQKAKWCRDAVIGMMEGRAEEVLTEYAKRGLFTIAENREEAMKALVKDWKRKGIKAPKDNLIFTSTNFEAATINRMIQHDRKLKGQLGLQYATVGEDRFYKGDRVLLCKNMQSLDICNGQLGTVCGINSLRSTLSLRTDDGRIVTILLGQYSDIKLGYALTTHKGQGVTTRNAFLLMGGNMTDRELGYVQFSRASHVTKLYIDKAELGESFADLAQQMNKSHQKDLAVDHEISQPSVTHSPSPSFRR
jgi:Ti-type conjugative transfer relaxase TraA